MQIITGTISYISNIDPYNTGYQKREVVIESTDNQSTKIEFQGPIKDILTEFKTGDQVTIAFVMKCSTSQKSGITFNNNIAKSIKKVIYDK